MVRYLLIQIILLTFAVWIVGSHDPTTRGKSVAPSTLSMTDTTKTTDNMPRRLTKEEFVAKAIAVHGDKYSYENVEYKGTDIPVSITCKKHGPFLQTPNTHLHGCGCKHCKGDKIHLLKNKGAEQFVIDARRVHGNVYDYSESVYVNNKTPLKIICNIHGAFSQTPNTHLRGCGCRKCADDRTVERCRMTLEEFLSRSKAIHGDKYDYSLVTADTLVNSHTEIEIICPKHGVFKQSPNEHLSGRGCYWCGKESMARNQALTRDEVVDRCNKQFNYKYDYSLFTEYHSKKDIIMVICPKHGAWPVSVSNHLYRKSGCPHCKRSLGEERVVAFLEAHGIEHREQYRVPNVSLFCDNTLLMADFFLPKFNVIIEYNGIQHYEQSPMFDTRTLAQQQSRDEAMRMYCVDNKIKLIEIPYTKFDEIEAILSKELHIKT